MSILLDLILLQQGISLRLNPCSFPGFGIDWTVEKCNKYIVGWEAAVPTIGAAAGGALLLLRCHGEQFILSPSSPQLVWHMIADSCLILAIVSLA